MTNKLKLLKLTLRLGALYYFIGAIAHYFDLTLFPWYVAELRAPYHDVLITLCSLTFAILLLVIANNPVKNIDTLKVVIVCAAVASLASILIIYKVDFTALGAPEKTLQTVTEGILGFIFVGCLVWLYPKNIII